MAGCGTRGNGRSALQHCGMRYRSTSVAMLAVCHVCFLFRSLKLSVNMNRFVASFSFPFQTFKNQNVWETTYWEHGRAHQEGAPLRANPPRLPNILFMNYFVSLLNPFIKWRLNGNIPYLPGWWHVGAIIAVRFRTWKSSYMAACVCAAKPKRWIWRS